VFKVVAKPKLNVDLPMNKGDFENSDRTPTNTSPLSPKKVAAKKERNASYDAKLVKRS